MSYYFSKKLRIPFDRAIEQVTQALASNGFGILTSIDVRATMKKKLNIEFRPYTILGACNPQFAYRALQLEDKVGTMLPCNVVVQEIDHDEVEVSAIDPIASMAAIKNSKLDAVAAEVGSMLKLIIDRL